MTTPEKHPLKEDVRREIDHTLADLARMRDEAKVRLHLGGMDFVDGAADIEAQLLKLRDAAHDARGDAETAIRTALTSVRGGLTALRKRLDAAAKA